MIEQATMGNKKLDMNFIILSYIHELGLQLLKLPNEIIDQDVSGPLGVTYSSIKQSYIDGVAHLEFMVLGMSDDIEAYKHDISKITSDDEFTISKNKIRYIVAQCDRNGLMPDKTIITQLDTPIIEDESIIN